MPWSILHRYVLFELLRVGVLSLTAVTGILVMAGIVAEASQQGFGPDQIIKVVPILIPGTLPYTVPAAVLFAVSVVYGRLSSDNEITAIKSAGIPVTRVVWPGILLGVGLSGMMVYLYNDFIPSTHNRVRTMAIDNIEEIIYTFLRKDGQFNHPKVNYAIYVKEVQGRRLIEPIFKRRDHLGREEIVARAREAELSVDLDQGIVNVLMVHCDIVKDYGRETASLEREVFPVPLPPIGAAREIRPREMTRQQLLDRRSDLEKQQGDILQQIAAVKKESAAKRKSAKDAEQLAHLNHRLDDIQKDVWQADTEFHRRPALSLSSLFFVLLGCPVGIWFHKRDYLSAFVTCFLPIVLVYYPLMMFGINLGKQGRLDPMISMWVGNAVLGLTGLFLLWRLLRR